MSEKDQLDELQKALSAARTENNRLKLEKNQLKDELRKYKRFDKLNEILGGLLNLQSGTSSLFPMETYSKDIAERNRAGYFADELQKRIDRLNLIANTIVEAEKSASNEGE